jgi:putative ATPase
MKSKRSLFDTKPDEDSKRPPLADRMRPLQLEEILGQDHLLGSGKVLQLAIEQDEVPSMILWGPPGTGKTTIAGIIAAQTRSHYVAFSAVLSGVKEVKEVMQASQRSWQNTGRRTVLFVDEIHRFNKAQQDAFLPYVENGEIILIGATTENPSFEVISALLSRVKVYVLRALEPQHIQIIIRRSLEDADRGLGRLGLEMPAESVERLAIWCNGDARMALNVLEIAARHAIASDAPQKIISNQILDQVIQQKGFLYDKQGEEHFNVISALHKTMRNSDPDAALYWLARMLEAGEDPLYVARRIVRFASEDVGLADPRALGVALEAKDAVHFLGMPECNVALAQAVIYLALAPKSNSAYTAYQAVRKSIDRTPNEPVPLHLRNAPTRLMEELDYGRGYEYAHDMEEKVSGMSGLPDRLEGSRFYYPTEEGLEKRLKERLDYFRGQRGRMRDQKR